MHQPHKFYLILFSCLFLYSLSAFALPNDNEQVLHIVADSSTFNYKTGKNIYQGNVKITQGTTQLKADKLITLNNEKHKVKEAIAFGIKNPAEYSTLPQLAEPKLFARASIIKFYPIKSLAILEGNVEINQGKNNFHGPIIIYNIKDQIVTAPSSSLGRATIIVEPK